MSKLNRILAAILLLQVALIFYVYWPEAQAGAGEVKPLFADLDIERITGMTFYDENGKHLKLAKDENSWIIPSKNAYPADNEKVNGLLDKIAALNTRTLIAKTKSSHRRLKVAKEQYNRMIEMSYEASNDPYRLYLGSSPAYRKIHIRNGLQNEVYLTKEISAWEVAVDASTWINHKYLDLPVNKVADVTIENMYGQLEFEKNETGSWIIKGLENGKKVDQTSVDNLLKKALSIRMIEPLAKQEQESFGMQKPSVFITIKTSKDATEANAGEEITIKVGAKNEEKNSYVVKSSKSPFYVRVSGFTIEDLASAQKEKLLKTKSDASE